MIDIAPLRAEMDDLVRQFETDTDALKDPNAAFLRVSRWYEHNDKSKQVLVNEVLDEWIVGDDLLRHDLAVMLVREFQLLSLCPALQCRVDALRSVRGSEYRRKLLTDLIRKLELA